MEFYSSTKKLLLIFCIFFITLNFAQTDFQIKWSVYASAGGKSSSSNFRLFDASGLNLFGPMSSANYRLTGEASTATHVNSPTGNKGLPTKFGMKQNYPNPFNPNTNIEFALPKPAEVEILIYNILGKKVKSFVKNYYEAGNHRLVWDASDDYGEFVGTGMYIFVIRVLTNDDVVFQDTKKMTLLR